jgi:hypothetical protein
LPLAISITSSPILQSLLDPNQKPLTQPQRHYEACANDRPKHE